MSDQVKSRQVLAMAVSLAPISLHHLSAIDSTRHSFWISMVHNSARRALGKSNGIETRNLSCKGSTRFRLAWSRLVQSSHEPTLNRKRAK